MSAAGIIALLKNWKVLAGLGLVVAFALWLFLHDRAVVANHDAKIEAAAAAAREQAAAERVADATTAEGEDICVECDEPIEPARKAALPSADRCLACQQQHERMIERGRRGL